MSHRFFIPQNQISWNEKKASITDSDQTYKITKVLRLRENDQVVLLDGNGLVYNAQISSMYSRAVQCRLLSRRSSNTEAALKITIAQSLLKGPRFDYALQKCTEIGISEFIPLTTERTIIKLEDGKTSREFDRKTDRYQKIVQDAAEQSERGIIPFVKDIMTLEELTRSNIGSYDLKLACLERTNINGVKEVLNSLQDKVQKILLVVGPEGGFTDSESKLLTSSGFTSVSLGKRIYRAETVGILLSGILFFFFNELQ